jgi:hypothetical protein
MAKTILQLTVSVGFLLAICIVSVRAVQAQQQADGTVAFLIHVSDVKGRCISGLQLKDFRLFEDGVAQKIASVEEGENFYRITYLPAGNNNEGFRRLKVEVSGGDYRVRHRSGYRPSK